MKNNLTVVLHSIDGVDIKNKEIWLNKHIGRSNWRARFAMNWWSFLWNLILNRHDVVLNSVIFVFKTKEQAMKFKMAWG